MDYDLQKNVTVTLTMNSITARMLRDALAEVYAYATEANSNWRTDPALVRDLYERLGNML